VWHRLAGGGVCVHERIPRKDRQFYESEHDAPSMRQVNQPAPSQIGKENVLFGC
jgi:hypothetical protein